jgi:hypothetical protein
MTVDSRNPFSTDWTRPIRRAYTAAASADPLANGECRAIYLGTAGDVTVTGVDGVSWTMKNLAAGVWHPVAATHVTTLANSAADCMVGY